MKQLIKQASCVIAMNHGLHLRRRRPTGVLTILMYHRVNENITDSPMSVRPEHFNQQMKCLSRIHQTLHLGDAVDLLSAGELSSHVFCVTFDDGYLDNFRWAFPILKQHGVPASIFVATDAITRGSFPWELFDRAVMRMEGAVLDLRSAGGAIWRLGGPRERTDILADLHQWLKTLPDERRREVQHEVAALDAQHEPLERTSLNWEELREMLRSGLISVGSHTRSHPILSRTPVRIQESEIRGSKEDIELHAGWPVCLFAYPNGGRADFTVDTLRIVGESGYKAACTTVAGDNYRNTDMLQLKRVDVTPGVYLGHSGRFSEKMFEAYITGALAPLFPRIRPD